MGKATAHLDWNGLGHRLRGCKSYNIESVTVLGPLGHPLLGILTIVLGVVGAIAALPDDVTAAGAVRLPALILAVALCLVPFLQAFRHPTALLRAEHILVMSPVFWLLLDPIQGSYDLPGIGPGDVAQTFLAIGLFAAGVWLAQLGRPWVLPRFVRVAATKELSSNTLFAIGVVAFGLAFCRFAIPAQFDLPFMIKSLGGGRWSAPWSRGELGGADAFLDHLSYFGYLIPSLAVLLARRVGWTNLRTLILLALGGTIALFLAQGGGRRIVGVIFGSAAIVWYLGQHSGHWRKLIGLALILAVLLAVLGLMLDYRNVGLRAIWDSGLREEVVANDATGEVLIRVDDNFLRLAQMTIIFPELHPYTTWHYALWVVSRPVPRLLWPGKPIDSGFSLPEFLGPFGASLSSSVIGELIMAGGLIAVALGGYFYGRLAGALSGLLRTGGYGGELLVFGIGALALFAGMRSMIELVLMSYGILAWAVLVSVIKKLGHADLGAHSLRR